MWGPPRPIHRPGKWQFRKFLTSHEKWGGAPSCWKYIWPRLFKGTSSKIWGNSSCRNRRYASPLRRPSKMNGPISWSSRTAHQILTLKCTWKLLSTVAWGFSSAHTRVVCIIYTIPIELRFVSKQDVTMQLATANEPLANFSLWAKLPGPRCCTHCRWYGYMPSACSVHHTLMWKTQRRLAILHILARGLLCTIWTMSSSSTPVHAGDKFIAIWWINIYFGFYWFIICLNLFCMI